MTAATCALVSLLTAQPQIPMRSLIDRLEADSRNVNQYYNLDLSEARLKRRKALVESYEKELKSVKFENLGRDEQFDWVLLNNWLHSRQIALQREETQLQELGPFLPFANEILSLEERRQQMHPVEIQKAAKVVNGIPAKIAEVKKKLKESPKADATIANRAADAVGKLRTYLGTWFKFYEGYDPQFSWWLNDPYRKLDASLEEFGKFLREELAGIKDGDKDAIIGHPIGREALIESLQAEMISYTPEELIAIGEKEYQWCEKEAQKAASEMGFHADWRKALEKVKDDHVQPGEQPQLIRELAIEAIQFCKRNKVVTIPPLAEETWRMEMMSPERQKVSPFFLGGDTIIVSFPTDAMTQEEKVMSMRSNNRHFARATVFHELFPGHALQQFSESRNKPYRRLFATPFWTEGWALWMEMHFWNLGFPLSPENRLGMLFWRMHRCVRIEFSLGFHLGKLSPKQCVDLLVKKVGHERSTAEGEVRRSLKGDYGPLYQLAYMIGALQFRALVGEIVGTGNGKLSFQKFHDAVLEQGNIPITVLREIVHGRQIDRDFQNNWRFAD